MVNNQKDSVEIVSTDTNCTDQYNFDGELLSLLQDIRIQVAASAQASHITDGFEIVDGLPRSRKVVTDEDRLLQRVDAAIASLSRQCVHGHRQRTVGCVSC